MKQIKCPECGYESTRGLTHYVKCSLRNERPQPKCSECQFEGGEHSQVCSKYVDPFDQPALEKELEKILRLWHYENIRERGIEELKQFISHQISKAREEAVSDWKKSPLYEDMLAERDELVREEERERIIKIINERFSETIHQNTEIKKGMCIRYIEGLQTAKEKLINQLTPYLIK